jgi:uncharacterized protein DUF6496
MPDSEEKATKQRARRDKAAGKSASTQAGEFVREEIDHIREGRHGARSAKQAIAIGLSKARRAGVALPPPKRGPTSERTRRSAARDAEHGRHHGASKPPSKRRSRAALGALEREGDRAASPEALSRQARSAAARRPARERSASARRAAKTKGAAKRRAAARKGARTRATARG